MGISPYMVSSKEAMWLSFSRAGAKGTGELGSLQMTGSREVKAGEPNRVRGQGRVSTERFQRGQRTGKGCKQGGAIRVNRTRQEGHSTWGNHTSLRVWL